MSQYKGRYTLTKLYKLYENEKHLLNQEVGTYLPHKSNRTSRVVVNVTLRDYCFKITIQLIQKLQKLSQFAELVVRTHMKSYGVRVACLHKLKYNNNCRKVKALCVRGWYVCLRMVAEWTVL